VKIDHAAGIGGGQPVPPLAGCCTPRHAAIRRSSWRTADAKPAAYGIAILVPGHTTSHPPQIGAAGGGRGGCDRRPRCGPQTLGGAAATRERIDWKRWMLWGSPVLGVAVLGLMAFRLGRQMSKPADPPKQ
jgi:hypothetical protein